MQGRPAGITVIALLLAIGGVAQVLIGTETLKITNLGLGAVVESAGISGSASLVAGVLSILAAIGLFRLSGWAWLLAVVVLIVRVLVDIYAIATHGTGSTLGQSAIANLVVSGILFWYFMRGSVRAAFGR